MLQYPTAGGKRGAADAGAGRDRLAGSCAPVDIEVDHAMSAVAAGMPETVARRATSKAIAPEPWPAALDVLRCWRRCSRFT